MIENQDYITQLQSKYSNMFDGEINNKIETTKNTNLQTLIEGLNEIEKIFPNILFVGIDSDLTHETTTYKNSNSPINDEQFYITEAIKVKEIIENLHYKKDSEEINKRKKIFEYYKNQYIKIKINNELNEVHK